MNAVVRHINWDVVKCLVLAGPGFTKDDLKVHMEQEAVRRDLRCPFRCLISSDRIALAVHYLSFLATSRANCSASMVCSPTAQRS